MTDVEEEGLGFEGLLLLGHCDGRDYVVCGVRESPTNGCSASRNGLVERSIRALLEDMAYGGQGFGVMGGMTMSVVTDGWEAARLEFSACTLQISPLKHTLLRYIRAFRRMRRLFSGSNLKSAPRRLLIKKARFSGPLKEARLHKAHIFHLACLCCSLVQQHRVSNN